MGFRSDLRTRLQLIQQNITGMKTAELNVPVAINVTMCPAMINFMGNTTYAPLSGQGSVVRGNMNLTMRLYLGVYNTVTAMENEADTFIPLVESAFMGNTLLSYNNAPLDIQAFRMLNNSGLLTQQYVVPSDNKDEPYYAVVEFPAIVSYNIRNC